MNSKRAVFSLITGTWVFANVLTEQCNLGLRLQVRFTDEVKGEVTERVYR